MATHLGYIYRLKSQGQLVKPNKQNSMKVLLNSCHMNSYTIGLKLPCTAEKEKKGLLDTMVLFTFSESYKLITNSSFPFRESLKSSQTYLDPRKKNTNESSVM